MHFRSLIWASLIAASATLLTSLADAHVLINVDKSTQQMTVSVDGAPRYRFTVSTGRAGFGTPTGTFHPQRMEPVWFSKEYYNSPMPHSIFFHSGFAIHGSYEIDALGGPASHGCIRLHPDDAATLYSLVESVGMEATTIVVSGTAPVGERSLPTGPDNLYPPLAPGYMQRYPPSYQQPPGYYYQQPPGYSYRQPPSYYGPRGYGY